MEFPLLYPKCESCGSLKTVANEVCKDDSSYPEATFFSLEKMATSIQDPLKIFSPTTKGIMVHYDVCFKCGTKRCTKVEPTSIPTDMLLAGMGMVRRPSKTR